MADDVGFVLRGLREVTAALDEMEARVDKATVTALKAASAMAKKSIRAKIKGRPRWDHRGRSSHTGDAVDLNLHPHVQERSGGPGVLTGSLRRGVGYVKRPKRRTANVYVGGVGVGGGVRNLYKGRLEEDFPYVKPGMADAEPKFPAVFSAAWERAVHKK